jgi:hypothetical protein
MVNKIFPTMIYNTYPRYRWKFNGQHVTCREMADLIWPNDCQDKTIFLLRFLGDEFTLEGELNE